jgi:hypothetical protein
MAVGCVATRALLAGSARIAALQGCSRPRIPTVCLCPFLYLFDFPPLGRQDAAPELVPSVSYLPLQDTAL